MPPADICLHELEMGQLDTMSMLQLHTLPMECDPAGPEAGEWDFYSGDSSAMGLGNN